MIYWKAPQILSFYFLKTFKLFPPSSPLLSFESAPFPFFTWSIVAHFLLRLQFHPFLSTLHSLKIHSERGKTLWCLPWALGTHSQSPGPTRARGAGPRAETRALLSFHEDRRAEGSWGIGSHRPQGLWSLQILFPLSWSLSSLLPQNSSTETVHFFSFLGIFHVLFQLVVLWGIIIIFIIIYQSVHQLPL